jgi:hypothetical protein
MQCHLVVCPWGNVLVPLLIDLDAVSTVLDPKAVLAVLIGLAVYSGPVDHLCEPYHEGCSVSFR